MGWVTGAEVAESVWSVIEGFLDGLESPEEAKAEVALELVEIFEGHDCDTMEEVSFVQEYLEFGDWGWEKRGPR